MAVKSLGEALLSLQHGSYPTSPFLLVIPYPTSQSGDTVTLLAVPTTAAIGAQQGRQQQFLARLAGHKGGSGISLRELTFVFALQIKKK